jgi:hypothetical protein
MTTNTHFRTWVFIPFFLLLILVAFSNNGQTTSQTNHKPTDFIILLDLSDRLLKANQVTRDTAIINHILAEFESLQRKQLFIKSKDKFSLVVAPQRDAQSPEQYDNFIYNPVKMTDRGAPSFNKWKKQFQSSLAKLYTDATKGKTKPEHYNGADIWGYFDIFLPEYLEDKSQNVVIVLTDGYFDFEKHPKAKRIGNRFNHSGFYTHLRVPTWQTKLKDENWGLLKPQKNLVQGTTVIVLEIQPKYDWADEHNLIKAVWQKWLTEQGPGCTHTVLHQIELATLKEKISNGIKTACTKK